MQSVRGTFGSGGEFTPVVNEEHDGQDTVVWLREQPWFDGRLATLGPSYLAYTQWALALDPPPELKAMILHIGPHDLAQAGMIDGAFQLTNLAIWTELLAHQERVNWLRGIVRLTTAERRLGPHFGVLPLQGLAERFGGNPSPWFDEWLAHPDLEDPYWDRYRATPAVHSSTVPALLIGGWQDWFVEQTLYQYAVLRDRGVDVALTLGPWTHLTIDAAVTAPESLTWLNTYLPVDGAPPARAAARPGARARQRRPDLAHDARLAAGDHRPHLVPRPGRAAGGRRARPRPARPRSPTTRWTRRPRSAAGSWPTARASGTTGSSRRATTSARSPPSRCGSRSRCRAAVRVRLVVESDNPYADLFVRLCDVEPSGKSVNITDRLVRLDPAPGEEPHDRPADRRADAGRDRAPLPRRAPHPAAGLRRRAPALRPQPRHRRAARRGHPRRPDDPPHLRRRRDAVLDHPAHRLTTADGTGATRRDVDSSTPRAPSVPPGRDASSGSHVDPSTLLTVGAWPSTT